MFKKMSFFVLCLFCAVVEAWSADLNIIGRTDKDPLSYQKGEEMVFSIELYDGDQRVGGHELFWTRRGDDGKTEGGEVLSSETEPLVIKTSLDVPGFVHILVRTKGENGEILGESGQFNGGAGVLLDQIAGYPEPDDFDAFWTKQKEKLAAVPLRADRVEVESGNPAFVLYDVKVDCAGGKPVSGYLSFPRDAAEKSLPAEVTFHGYGVGPAKKVIKDGTLSLCINAHGIENGQPGEFYENLKKTTLAGYGFSPEENADPETCYWNGMILRVLRALEYVKSLPEWNGKDLTVIGGSQGGFQSLSAAGLDPDVSHCVVVVPWFCNLAGFKEQNRVKSHFMPEWVPALGYYDSTNQAKRIQCSVEITVGLGDYVCPPSGEMVLFNNLKCPTQLSFFQGRTHGYCNMKEATVSKLTK